MNNNNNNNSADQVYSVVSRPMPPPSPPSSYMPTSFNYVYNNFGLHVFDGAIQHFRLERGVLWKPTTPTTLILAMNTMNLIKVGLPPQDVSLLNSVMFEMRRALPHRLRDHELEYVTHNSLIFMQFDDATNVQVLQGEYIIMQPPSILHQWSTCCVKAVSLRASIVGLKKCCDKFSPKIHVDSIMVENGDGDDDGISDINTTTFHVL